MDPQPYPGDLSERFGRRYPGGRWKRACGDPGFTLTRRRTALAVGAVVLVAIGIYGIPKIVEHERYYRFDRDLWRRHSQHEDQWRRYYMGCYLRDKGLLLGKTRSEVLQELGQEESAPLRYPLGPGRGLFPVDGLWLQVTFGQDGRVAECRLVPD